MSLTRIVTVHCDTCGQWEYTHDATARQRREAGWRSWRDEKNARRDACPRCATTAETS